MLFLLTACGKNQVKSELEETKLSLDDIMSILNDVSSANSMKYFSAVVLEEGRKPKCRISLEGKPDLALDFAEIHPAGDSVNSKEIVSLEKAQGMTEEEKERVVVLPADLATLPDCAVEGERFSVSQMVQDMRFIGDTEEKVFGSRKKDVFMKENAFTCLLVYLWLC